MAQDENESRREVSTLDSASAEFVDYYRTKKRIEEFTGPGGHEVPVDFVDGLFEGVEYALGPNPEFPGSELRGRSKVIGSLSTGYQLVDQLIDYAWKDGVRTKRIFTIGWQKSDGVSEK